MTRRQISVRRELEAPQKCDEFGKRASWLRELGSVKSLLWECTHL